jgi:2-methylcitrate dehydratase PrpD
LLSVQDQFAAFAARIETNAPKQAYEAAERVFLDWLGVAARGAVTAPSPELRRALRNEIGYGPASLVPDGIKATPRAAAFINGAASHAIEFDDIFREAIYHPGVVVIPAALAAAETAGCSGKRFLAAIIAGYEVSNRIGAAMIPGHYAYWHTTGTVGAFGAAVGAGVALGLNAQQMANAISTVATMAAGLQQAFRSDAMLKPVHAGQAAQNGITAAFGAEAGLKGAPLMLEGEVGFAAALRGEAAKPADFAPGVASLGERWTILETTQKNHSSCGHGFAAIDAMLDIVRSQPIETTAVRAIRVGTYSTAIKVTGDWNPKTAYEAQFSLPYVVSAALVRRSGCRFEAFEDRWLSDLSIRDLMNKVTLDVDAEAEAGFPARRGAAITIELVDGATLSARRQTRKGDPDDPLSLQELSEKFIECAEPCIGKDGVRRLLTAAEITPDLADMSTFAESYMVSSAAAE